MSSLISIASSLILLGVIAPAAHASVGPPTGACCIDGQCHMLTAEHCAAEGGEFLGDVAACHDDTCGGPATGACCVGDGCHMLTAEHCAAEGKRASVRFWQVAE